MLTKRCSNLTACTRQTQPRIRDRSHAIAMPFATMSFIYVAIMAVNALQFGKPSSP